MLYASLISTVAAGRSSFSQAQSHHPSKPSVWRGGTSSPHPLWWSRAEAQVSLGAFGYSGTWPLFSAIPRCPPEKESQAHSCRLTGMDCMLHPPIGKELLPTAVQGDLVVHILGGEKNASKAMTNHQPECKECL